MSNWHLRIHKEWREDCCIYAFCCNYYGNAVELKECSVKIRAEQSTLRYVSLTGLYFRFLLPKRANDIDMTVLFPVIGAQGNHDAPSMVIFGQYMGIST